LDSPRDRVLADPGHCRLVLPVSPGQAYRGPATCRVRLVCADRSGNPLGRRNRWDAPRHKGRVRREGPRRGLPRDGLDIERLKAAGHSEDEILEVTISGAMHYIDGILFAVLFAITLHPRLPWANTEVGNVLKGIVFGTILAVIALGVLTPLVLRARTRLRRGGVQHQLRLAVHRRCLPVPLDLRRAPRPGLQPDRRAGRRVMTRQTRVR